jgi:hypothetical protein
MTEKEPQYGFETEARKPDPPTPFCFAAADHETLALIDEHQLLLSPTIPGGWGACQWTGFGPMPNPEHMVRYGTMATWAEGPTIGDAVRACVRRMNQQRRD